MTIQWPLPPGTTSALPLWCCKVSSEACEKRGLKFQYAPSLVMYASSERQARNEAAARLGVKPYDLVVAMVPMMIEERDWSDVFTNHEGGWTCRGEFVQGVLRFLSEENLENIAQRLILNFDVSTHFIETARLNEDVYKSALLSRLLEMLNGA